MRLSKKSVVTLGIGLVFLIGLGTTVMDAQSPDSGEIRDADWKKIEQSTQQGLPETAIKQIEALLPRARRSSDNDGLIRLLCLRATMQASKQGGGEEERIIRLQNEYETAPAETRPVLNAILANWFWNYYQRNQWRFRNRTEVAGELEDPSSPIKSAEDLKTWSRQRIVAKATVLFEQALDDSESLQAIAIDKYDAIMVKGNTPDEYRPTLFDFLVADAIKFYADAESTYAGPINTI